MNYSLNIRFTEDILKLIAKADQRIVLVKHTAANNDTPVSLLASSHG